jgi:hypothetical protein
MNTPQEKKRLSYAKDRRNTFAENSKASRKGIPLHKAREIRAERHSQNMRLAQSLGVAGVEALEVVENDVRATPPRTWKKDPDKPLGVFVARKLARRARRVGARIARRRRADER